MLAFEQFSLSLYQMKYHVSESCPFCILHVSVYFIAVGMCCCHINALCVLFPVSCLSATCLSGGAVAGIVIACFVVIVIIIAIIVVLLRQRNSTCPSSSALSSRTSTY